MRRVALVMLSWLVATVASSCVSEDPGAATDLRAGDYAESVVGARFRFDLARSGDVEGYNDGTRLHCRGRVTEDEWTRLTSALNAANAMHRADHLADCTGMTEGPWPTSICTETVEATHCFTYWDWPRAAELDEVVLVAGEVMIRLWGEGACGPDRYPPA